MEEAPEARRSLGAGDHLQPLAEEFLALVVHEDVRPPERMLDELQALLDEMRRLAPDLDEVGERVVVRSTIRVPHQRGVHEDR